MSKYRLRFNTIFRKPSSAWMFKKRANGRGARREIRGCACLVRKRRILRRIARIREERYASQDGEDEGDFLRPRGDGAAPGRHPRGGCSGSVQGGRRPFPRGCGDVPASALRAGGIGPVQDAGAGRRHSLGGIRSGARPDLCEDAGEPGSNVEGAVAPERRLAGRSAPDRVQGGAGHHVVRNPGPAGPGDPRMVGARKEDAKDPTGETRRK